MCVCALSFFLSLLMLTYVRIIYFIFLTIERETFATHIQVNVNKSNGEDLKYLKIEERVAHKFSACLLLYRSIMSNFLFVAIRVALSYGITSSSNTLTAIRTAHRSQQLPAGFWLTFSWNDFFILLLLCSSLDHQNTLASGWILKLVVYLNFIQYLIIAHLFTNFLVWAQLAFLRHSLHGWCWYILTAFILFY